ncbi:NUDIX hydrolase [Actinopolymorpha cephalotaxi]|uniref:8-oxo-dGTP pyrophosphatase MutT (NUDIX family) n=1 Tax=Actinopolymorpha cephalotaxi TaxID=504797 RepID=A0ABX2S178_9ACTN|nr:NUDIX domain-containing protein [Actinopolymorpha cephalotaxi]NYH83378.1 8-oxo-dGTP pyrophosphatase MutT (NUDIX family) [Actinopolymorpha cephalotaxi]
MPGSRIRSAVRLLVVDPLDRLLLFHANPGRGHADGFWFCPGGGVQAGESALQAATRELNEETGLHVDPDRIRGPVWTRRHVVPLAHADDPGTAGGERAGSDKGAYDDLDAGDALDLLDQREQFFVYRAPNTPAIHAIGDPWSARDGHQAYRWWSRRDLEAGPADAAVFAPRRLPELFPEILAGRWENPPRDVGA